MNVFTSGYWLVWSFLLPDARYFEQIIHYHRIFLQPKPPKRLSKFIQSLLLLIHLWKHEGAESRGVEESCGMFTLPHTMLNCQLTVKLGPDTGPRQYAPGHGACADRASVTCPAGERREGTIHLTMRCVAPCGASTNQTFTCLSAIDIRCWVYLLQICVYLLIYTN